MNNKLLPLFVALIFCASTAFAGPLTAQQGGILTGSVVNAQVLKQDNTLVCLQDGTNCPENLISGETDPVFSSSPAFTILQTNMTNWNNARYLASVAFAWGDHELAGYVVNETDPIFLNSPASSILQENIDAWNEVASNGGGSGGLEVDPIYAAEKHLYPRTDQTNEMHGENYFLARVGIGTSLPVHQLDIVENFEGINYPLKIGNQFIDQTGIGTGMLFRTGTGGPTRGKGAIVYVYGEDPRWNWGDFHFLQNTESNVDNPDLSDSVMVIKNNGNVGIGTQEPESTLEVDGSVLFRNGLTLEGLRKSRSPDYVLVTDEDSGRIAYIEGNFAQVNELERQVKTMQSELCRHSSTYNWCRNLKEE